MRKIAVVGGRLQGIEACLLARQAGISVLLVDKDANAPARGLCDAFEALDVTEGGGDLLASCDLVLPCTENDAALAALVELSEKRGFTLAFDPAAYAVTSSKLKTDALFHASGVPSPRYYPEAEPPYVVKPSDGSGSQGVRMLETREETETFLRENPGRWVVQEYLEGPSYSIEVIGFPGAYRAYTVTQIHVDEGRDCCRVTAPCDITEERDGGFAELGIRLAELVGLRGIMDVEVIDNGGVFKVLELDARLPSQTPLVVLRSSGVNLLSELFELWTNGRFVSPYRRRALAELKCAEYLNCLCDGGKLSPHGEHIMAGAGELRFREDFMGFPLAATDFEAGGAGRGIFIR